MKKLLVLLVLLAAINIGYCQKNPAEITTYTPSASNLLERDHFQDMKFGMFIHWGIYSILGDGEWVMHNEKIPYDNYKRLADFFNPASFNAKQWVTLVKAAGMKYITITSRHHDGFSMFKTKASSYNIVEATPYKKDPLMELALECKKQGIELHFYYSLLDWGRKDYAFGSPIKNGEPSEGDWKSYISFMKAQLTELITNYPAVKGIWFDGYWERTQANWHLDEIYALIHKLDPTILVGNNHHISPLNGEDFQMFEKDLPGENSAGFNKESKIGALPLETCETINNSWGFNINDRKYKNVKQIIHYLVNAAGRNANFLLNVGPMPNGKIQSEFTDSLSIVGKWIKENGTSIYGTRGNIIPAQPWGVATYKGHFLYCHILNTLLKSEILIPSFGKKITSAVSLNGTIKYSVKEVPEGTLIVLNNVKQDDIDTIIKVTF